MKKLLLTGIAVLFLATGEAHAGVDLERGKCYTSDHVRVPCSVIFGKDWRKKIKEMRDEEKLRECYRRHPLFSAKDKPDVCHQWS
jgi:hypothetical protein